VAAARAAQPAWAALPAHHRARYLYAIARHLQKHHRLLAVLEAMDNGKSVRETRDADIPLAIRHFYHHAGWAQLMDSEMAGFAPVGTIGMIIPWNFPALMLAWKIAPALAMGNTMVLKPAPWTRLTAWLFAEICAEVGLPKGVVNVISGDNDMADYMATHDGFDKVAFTGSTAIGQHLRRQTAGTGKKLSLELGGKSPIIVYESSDLDSAVEGLVNGIWFNQGQVCCAGSRLLVQESVYDVFIAKLKRRMQTLRLGHSLDKALDMGPMADPIQRDRVAAMVDIGREEGLDIFQPDYEIPENAKDGCFYPPTLITGAQSTSRLVQEEIFGPVLVAQSFRSPKEAIALANNTRYGLSAGVWTESIGLALETALSVRAGVVWVNIHNAFDAAAGFGGYKESGFGREGGREGLFEYAKPAWMKAIKAPKLTEAEKDPSKFGVASPGSLLPAIPGSSVVQHPPSVPRLGGDDKMPSLGDIPAIDRTPKMYVGGAQKRPDHSYVRPVYAPDGSIIAQVGDGNRKDIRDAVEAAHKAWPDWGKRAAYNRAQILYYIAENLNIREGEFADRIGAMTGKSREDSLREVEASISRLFTYAAYADKYGGEVQETPLYGVVNSVFEPVGVVGIACPEENPLLGFVSLVSPVVVRGNTCIVVPSQKHPLSATDLYQVLDTSDLPGGVINIVTGETDVLTKTLVEHQDVDSVWYFGSASGSYHVERLSAGNMKRTFVNYGHKRDWFDAAQGEGREFLREATEVKNIHIPMGE